ncbi:MAG TPA: AraC family transcriptional regulator [Acetobacteraceae bacterium]|nr:AraC family transcriptional regulator [Acetobacteraceae bacterium]
MGVAQLIAGYDRGGLRSQISYEQRAEAAPLGVVTGFLDDALRTWDDDRIRAKSQIRMAAAMLRDYADDLTVGLLQPVAPPEGRSLAPWQARKVKEFIEASLDSKIRLSDCASRARLSASYFAHAFKATFGMTVCHYIRRRRVEHSQQLMLMSQQPLSQIALACGFADQAHYCRVFRDVVGWSPNAWRRQHMTIGPDE